MLYLSREINETVMVGDEVEVKVMDINGKKVLLGFKAPKQIVVHREEVYRKNQIMSNFKKNIKHK